MPFPKISLLIFVSLVVQSCEKRGMGSSQILEDRRQDVMKCLKPYVGISKGLFSQDQKSLYAMIDWDGSADVVSEKIPLSETLFAIRTAKAGSSFTGRFMVCRNSGDHSEPLGSVAGFSELRYDYPSLRLIPDTKWLESKECVMAGTGVATCWSRYWIIADGGIHERLAVPTSGYEKMGDGMPWRTFALEPVASEFSDEEMTFAFNASCELSYAPEGVEETSSVILPEIHRTVYFLKSAGDGMILDERKSGLTLREFQNLTDTQLAFGAGFWEIYGDDIERMARGGDGESIRKWIDSNRSEGWAIPDKIKVAIGSHQ